MTGTLQPMNLSDFTGLAYCSYGGHDAPIDAFGFDRNKASGRQAWCRKCQCQAQRDRKCGTARTRHMSRRERMALLEPVVAPPTILHCSRCVSDLPVSEFTPQSNKKRGYQAWCKPCYAMYQRESKYGLSRDAIMEMLSGGCEGCGSIDNLCIDHCHATGVVRGVLCDGCNTAYGLLRDNALVVAGLLAYALKHGGAK